MRRTPFRPSPSGLETRRLPTASVYPDAFRTAIAATYEAQAAQAVNPVVLLGDSITLGWGTVAAAGPGAASFRSDFAPLGAANFGIAGDTTADVLGRVHAGDLAGRPAVAVVMVGINDLIDGATPDQAAAGVASVVGAIRAESPGTRVVLLSVLPTEVAPLNAEVDRLDARIAPLGAAPGVTYLDLRGDLRGLDGSAAPALMRDPFHPGPAGYAAIAGAIDAAVLDVLDPASASAAPATETETAAPAPATVYYLAAPDVPPAHHKASGGLAVGPAS